MVAVVLCLAAGLAVGAAFPKDFYMYKDSRGVVHFTDAPTDSRYRRFDFKAKGLTFPKRQEKLDPKTVEPYVHAAARAYQLDPALVLAVIKVESAFNPYAVSWAGAQGLMQLMPGTAELMGVTNVFSPRQNIFGGCRYLRWMLDRFKGDLKLALAAYNIGPERVARENKIPEVRETQAYVRLVLAHYKRYQKTI